MKGLARNLITMLSLAAVATVTVMAGSAFAQAGYPPAPQPDQVVKVLPRPAAVALTGSNILDWVLMAAACLIAGAMLVTIARRRTRIQHQA